MTSFAHATSAWSSNLFSPELLDEVAPRPQSHRFDPLMRRRALPAPAALPGAEPDRSEEEDERWDGLS